MVGGVGAKLSKRSRFCLRFFLKELSGFIAVFWCFLSFFPKVFCVFGQFWPYEDKAFRWDYV